MRPFYQPKVETTILIDTAEKPKFYSSVSKSKKKAEAQQPIQSIPEKKKQTKKSEPVPPPAPTSTKKGDGSSEIVASLDEIPRRVFEAIPADRAISLDKLMALGYKVNELIAATTVLEIKGLINSLPGNLYARK